jgi:hypothetical protein
MDEDLVVVGQPAATQPPPAQGPSVLTILGFALLALNAAMAVYSSNRSLGVISFVAFLYLDFILLVYCLALHDGAPPGSARREHLKVAVWLLTTMLTFASWPLLEFWFQITANVAGNSSMSFQNHTTCTQQLHRAYLPTVPW